MNTTTLLSLASLYFFAPLVAPLVKKNAFGLNAIEKNTVQSAINLGIINIGMLLLYLGTLLASNYTSRERVQIISTIAIIIVILVTIGGTIMIMTGATPTDTDYSQQLAAFVPIYQLQQWYQYGESDQNPTPAIYKE